MLAHLYALRANSLWKNEPHSTWLVSTVTKIEDRLGSTTPARDIAREHFAQGPTEAMVRHANVADLRAISAYRSPRSDLAVTHAFDPIPPSTSLSTYDESYFRDVPRGGVAGDGPSMDRGQHIPGEFMDDDDNELDIEGMDPQILLNHLMDQAEAGEQAVRDFHYRTRPKLNHLSHTCSVSTQV